MSTGGRDLRCDSTCFVLIEIGHDDDRSISCKPPGYCFADAAPASRNHCDLAVEPGHHKLPPEE
jgi:hypothetical protein